MGIWLFLAIILQLACAIWAAKLERPAFWLDVILLIPLLGSLAYCGFEIRQLLAGASPYRSAEIRTAAAPAGATLGWLGYQAVRARTSDSRRALAEECMRVGRHADARLLFESCMVGRHARDPRLISGLAQATAALGLSAPPADIADDGAASSAL